MIHLKTKKDEHITAYQDTMIFHAKQGEYDFNIPYGIIKCSKYSDPFGLTFEGLKVKIKPGILSCYGREVEINSTQEVIDMSSSVDAQIHYVNVYIEINLEDITNETATIRTHITGANYEAITSVYRDNLYKLSHGIFLVPIAHFQYNPQASSPFSDYAKYIEEYNSESVTSTQNIREEDSINNKAFSSLFTLEDNKVKANKASNEEAIEIYNAKGTYKTTDPYYTVAKETGKIGGVTINQADFNLLTVRRNTLISFSNSSFNKNYTSVQTFTFDHQYNKKIRFFFKGKGGNLTLNYQEKNDILTLGQWQKFTRTIELASYDQELIMDLSKAVTTAQFTVYIVAKFICNRYQPTPSSDWVSERYCELELSDTAASENDYFISTEYTGSTYTEENMNVRKTIATLQFQKQSSKRRKVTYTGKGESAEGSNGLLHWQYLTPSLTLKGSTTLMMDVVYEGGVAL